jgi:hypothetical protein
VLRTLIVALNLPKGSLWAGTARRFEHTVKLERESDIDDQLLKWLKDAYDLSK